MGRLEDYFKRLGDPIYARRRHIQSMVVRHNTNDVIRLSQKLVDPDFKGLMLLSEDLMSRENIELYEPTNSTWVEDILYQMHYDTDIKDDDEDDSDRQSEYERRRDVVKWREAFSDILECFSWERLDLSWDLAWSFYVSYRNAFRQGHLKVYSSIIGPIPNGLDGVPFQSILTSERKLRQRRKRERIGRAVLNKDYDELIHLGLIDEEITKAFERADIITARGSTLEASY
tara:strand:+ start:7408 stop:8097 length:690 start_codon:yes stop_codon:yes gene_type:complete